MFFILSDILHSLPIPNMSWCMALYGHGYPLHGLSSVHGVCGRKFRIVVLPHCGIVPLWGLILLLLGFPTTDIILPLWGKTKWVIYEFFHPFPIVGYYHVPLRHGIVGTRKPSPRTFIGQWAGEAYPTLHHVGYGGMSVCRHCVLFAYIIIIQDGGGKSNEKICFNIF